MPCGCVALLSPRNVGVPSKLWDKHCKHCDSLEVLKRQLWVFCPKNKATHKLKPLKKWKWVAIEIVPHGEREPNKQNLIHTVLLWKACYKLICMWSTCDSCVHLCIWGSSNYSNKRKSVIIYSVNLCAIKYFKLEYNVSPYVVCLKMGNCC